MELKKLTELHSFLSAHFSDSDPEFDEKTTQRFIDGASQDLLSQLCHQIRVLIEDSAFSIEEFGTEVNRWFADSEEARQWLRKIAFALEQATGNRSVVVKDSNGTELQEGDSVSVIKDLKVKGGSSDLKRGTLIKKIHLIGDPDLIECRVDGSTLVLKTCFLKKA